MTSIRRLGWDTFALVADDGNPFGPRTVFVGTRAEVLSDLDGGMGAGHAVDAPPDSDEGGKMGAPGRSAATLKRPDDLTAQPGVSGLESPHEYAC